MPRVQRKSIIKGYFSKLSKQTRIQMGQNPDRPFRVRYRLMQRSKYQPNPWWWILHRRGLLRPKVGLDPLEARAFPKNMLKGTLPERIVYQFLLRLNMIPNVDFSFQSSLQGGRIELGGIVVDFLFETRKMILQVQGPTHDQFLRMKKDEEQHMLLAQMGYDVVYMDMNLIYDEPRFEDEMRSVFSLPGYARGHVHGSYTAPLDGQYDRIEEIGRHVDDLAAQFLQIRQLIAGGA